MASYVNVQLQKKTLDEILAEPHPPTPGQILKADIEAAIFAGTWIEELYKSLETVNGLIGDKTNREMKLDDYGFASPKEMVFEAKQEEARPTQSLKSAVNFDVVANCHTHMLGMMSTK